MNFIEVNSEVLDLYDSCKDYNEIKVKEEEYLKKELENIQNRKNAKYEFEMEEEEDLDDGDKDDFDYNSYFKNLDVNELLDNKNK